MFRFSWLRCPCRWRWCCRCCCSWLLGGNQLEVLHGGNRYTSPKIQAPTLQLFMPPRSLVFQNQGHFRLFTVWHVIWYGSTNDFRKPWAAEVSGVVDRLWEGNAAERVFKGTGRKEDFWLTWHTATWLECWGGNRVHDAVHPTWPPCTKHIKLIGDMSNAIASIWHFWWDFFGIKPSTRSAWCWDKVARVWRWLCVIYYKLCSKKIRSEKTSIKRLVSCDSTKRVNNNSFKTIQIWTSWSDRAVYLSLPMYVLLDLEMLSASIEITYSVQVVLRVLLADSRNFPFSTSRAAARPNSA